MRTVKRATWWTLLLPESVMETRRWFELLSLWTKSFGVTIQMKPRQQYFHMVLFIFKFFSKRNLRFVLNFNFGHSWERKGSEGVTCSLPGVLSFLLFCSAQLRCRQAGLKHRPQFWDYSATLNNSRTAFIRANSKNNTDSTDLEEFSYRNIQYKWK